MLGHVNVTLPQNAIKQTIYFKTLRFISSYSSLSDIPHPQKISIQNQLIENYVAI